MHWGNRRKRIMRSPCHRVALPHLFTFVPVQQDNNPNNLVTTPYALGGGIGRVYTVDPVSNSTQAGKAPTGVSTYLVFGINTVFTRQFRGYSRCV